ncbi:MAG: Uma2 family endonuclease [Verrucomicrobiota bacterium]
MPAVLDIEPITDQHAFNIERWKEVCADPRFAEVPERVETNQYGHIIMSPPPGYSHGRLQSDLVLLFRKFLSDGKVATESPVSTRNGIRAADVTWISESRLEESLRENVLTIAPEICVEVLSPSNTKEEIEHKKSLYFSAGADEVWLCDKNGRLFFFAKAEPQRSLEASTLCPDFPAEV